MTSDAARVGRRGEVTVRPLTDSDDDIQAMVTWLSDPRVLEWFEGRVAGPGLARKGGQFTRWRFAIKPCWL